MDAGILRKWRFIVGTVLAVVALAACAPADAVAGSEAPPGPVAPPGPSQSAPGNPTCPAPGVLVTAGQVDAAMGLRAMGLTLVNCGATDYVADGYPDLRILDKDGAALDIEVLPGTSAVAFIERYERPPAPVTLSPGGQVHAVIVWRNTVDDLTRPVQLGKQLFVAPRSGQPLQAVAMEGGLDVGTTGRVAVSPWLVP